MLSSSTTTATNAATAINDGRTSVAVTGPSPPRRAFSVARCVPVRSVVHLPRLRLPQRPASHRGRPGAPVGSCHWWTGPASSWSGTASRWRRSGGSSAATGGARGCRRGDACRVEALRDSWKASDELGGDAVLYASLMPRAIETAESSTGARPAGDRQDCAFCEHHLGEGRPPWAEFDERYPHSDEGWTPDVRRDPGARWNEMAAGEGGASTASSTITPAGPSSWPATVGVIVQTMIRWLLIDPMATGERRGSARERADHRVALRPEPLRQPHRRLGAGPLQRPRPPGGPLIHQSKYALVVGGGRDPVRIDVVVGFERAHGYRSMALHSVFETGRRPAAPPPPSPRSGRPPPRPTRPGTWRRTRRRPPRARVQGRADDRVDPEGPDPVALDPLGSRTAAAVDDREPPPEQPRPRTAGTGGRAPGAGAVVREAVRPHDEHALPTRAEPFRRWRGPGPGARGATWRSG